MIKKFRITIFIIYLVCLSGVSFAGDRLLDIQEVKSEKGISAWLVEDHSLPIIALQFSFKQVGSALDSKENQGLAQLVSNTMDEGAGSYDSATFQKMLTDHNISLHFSAGRDNFGGRLKLLTKNKDMAFDMLRLALTAPRFDAEPVERMRAANLSRIRSSMADSGWKASRLMNDIAFSGHPYALNSGGTLTTLQTITAQDLHDFVKTRFSLENLRVGVMGDITPEELKTALDTIFGALPQNKALPVIQDLTVQNGGQTILYKQDIPQTMIEIMQPGIGRSHPDYYTGMVMNFILGSSGFGSRLTEEIREKRGLTYGINTAFYDLKHLQALTASTSTKNESAAEVLVLIDTEWRKMMDGMVSDKELANAKSYLIGSFPLSLSASDHIAALLLDLQLDDLPADYLDKRADRINAVTKEDIQALAKKLLTPDKLTIVLVGKPVDVAPTKIVDVLPNVE
ncbi:MAG: insulinase family protein [Alphaproteobacteria bacterium CG_4_9_14_3_um_filter_47_13]|nr:MAG: insulinase family protein [Alphaproteobacteria bacterium CG_4_9_14_3_um_filter_47_13]